jgi:uncharacterized OB-fold protein
VADPTPSTPKADPADSAGGDASRLTAEKVPNSGTGVSRYCSNCGSRHRDTERFCPQCGHAVT